jgi:hypothetical protein
MNSAAVGRIEKSRILSAHLFGSKSVFLVCCQAVQDCEFCFRMREKRTFSSYEFYFGL